MYYITGEDFLQNQLVGVLIFNENVLYGLRFSTELH